KRTGAAIANYVQNRQLPSIDETRYINEAKEQIQLLIDQPGQYRINQIRQAFQDNMTENCGVFRTDEVMRQGLEKIAQLQQKYSQIYLDDKGKSWNTELVEALELQSLMVVGQTILTSALNRQESRGAHFREDFAERDDNKFLQHTMAYYSPTGIDIQYRPVTITMFAPKERKY
ncbi:MAG: succinate dehydrogenase/fumarate reductase flavoprotein subunit, partial [Dolichospermum sp.]|nr:succinate dehydrogenase/fumarate reductase flavoprotein subunit [Dolichospermum sp.]